MVNLSSIDFFDGLAAHLVDAIVSCTTQVSIVSGEVLIQEGDQPRSLFIVVSGRFRVSVEGMNGNSMEIGPGHPIGEIGFFAGRARTATVTAIRDCVVLKLTKSDFLSVCVQHPKIWHKIVANLANRLAATTRGSAPLTSENSRTIAICPAGNVPIPELFFVNFKSVFSRHESTIFIGFKDCVQQFGEGIRIDSAQVTYWLNQLEQQYDRVFFFTDSRLSKWSAKVIRHADQVILVGTHEQNFSDRELELNQIECLVNESHERDAKRLILLHENTGSVKGTRSWLVNRKVMMHHHISLQKPAGYRRLFRFVFGNAIGLVASGGGAYSAAHIGLFRALKEYGIEFDIMGGTSGGGAITAALSLGIKTDKINQLIEEIFVKKRAFKRLNWPRYSILDHTVFDRQLLKYYSTRDITDLWINYYALSVNLSDGNEYIHRKGPIWEAVRATSSIPGLLPPFATDDGKLLVDGGIVDNIPLKSMKQLKKGPNIILRFEDNYNEKLDYAYSALPNRGKLLAAMLNPFSKSNLPDAPRVGNVLMRSMLLNNSSMEGLNALSDLQLKFSLPTGIGLMDWHKHQEITAKAYEFGCNQLIALEKREDPTLSKIVNLLQA